MWGLALSPWEHAWLGPFCCSLRGPGHFNVNVSFNPHDNMMGELLSSLSPGEVQCLAHGDNC